MSRCRKFESIIDGTVDRCEFSDDTASDESDEDDDAYENEDNDEDGDRTEDNGEDDYTDGTEEDGEDTDEYEDYEPSRMKKKKN